MTWRAVALLRVRCHLPTTQTIWSAPFRTLAGLIVPNDYTQSPPCVVAAVAATLACAEALRTTRFAHQFTHSEFTRICVRITCLLCANHT